MYILSSREKVLRILLSLKNRIASPSDVIANTGLPRYEVLAAFHILEALGLIELVYARGNYKLYTLTAEGEKLIEVLSSNKKPVLEIKASSSLSGDVEQNIVGESVKSAEINTAIA